MSRQNTNAHNGDPSSKPQDWQLLGFRSREVWQHWLNRRTSRWELYAEVDDIRYGIQAGRHVNAEQDIESETHVEPADEDEYANDVDSANGEDMDVTDPPYELPEEEYDHLLELLVNDAQSTAATRDYTDQPYQLPEEEYDPLLELPGDDVGDGLSEDFPAALIWKKSQKKKNDSDDEGSLDDDITSDQSAGSGSEDEVDGEDTDDEEYLDENSVNSKKRPR